MAILAPTQPATALFTDKENYTTAATPPKGVKSETVVAPSSTPRTLPNRRRHAGRHRARHSLDAVTAALTDPAVRRRAEGQLARSLLSSAGHSASMESSPSLTLQLPPVLPRPSFRQVDTAQLAALDPEWADVPLPYIHDSLVKMGPALLKNINISCTSVRHSRGMPSSVDVTFGAAASPAAPAPTHLLSVYSSARRARSTDAPIASTLVPVHAPVLTAHCAHLPPLPTAATVDSPAPGATRTLPVVPLRLPAQRETFWPLLRYLYTKSRPALLADLLPGAPPPPGSEDPAAHFVGTCDKWAIARALLRVHALWANVCALGIADDGLWSTMSCAYSILREAAARTDARLPSPAAADAMDVC